ncbi:hypothetical protein BG004_004363 [Podila humilis]|nr:hypothetical protein BG004_004363 [Podila humilis]
MDAPRYRLRVSVGPSANSSDLKPISLNDDAHPVIIESEEFVGQVVVRIKGLDKTLGYKEATLQDNTKLMPESPYFSKPGADSNLSSIQIQGHFKRAWPGDQVNQFERPLKLPPFSSIALKFIQYIDPGLEADIYGDKPWAFSPLIATMNIVNVSMSSFNGSAAASAATESASSTSTSSALEQNSHKCKSDSLPPWPSSEGDHIPEDTSLLFKPTDKQTSDDGKEFSDMAPSVAAPVSMTTSERRSFYSKSDNLKKHEYKPEHVYGFDFFNPYLNFANFTLKVPGFSVDITRYWDGQPLTYVMKAKNNSAVFLAIQFELVSVQELIIQ